jgi:ribosomal protein S27AE
MGRSYWFECPRCGYRARVSGREDRGLNFFVQTIVCHDCKELYDAVTRLRVPDDPVKLGNLSGWRWDRLAPPRNVSTPPSFQAVLNRLPLTGMTRFKWLRFKLYCPVSEAHRVRGWKDPDKCPKCGVFLERSALAYRLWE